MKFILTAAVLAFAGSVVAQTPYPCYLSQEDAEDIVGMYASIMQNQTYNGMLPADTLNVVLADNYTENSDSILSLVSSNYTLGAGAVALVTSKAAWYAGVSVRPIPTITTLDILVAGGSNILWYWIFEGVGIDTYPVKGFNLLRIDDNLQVYEADIEFNSIAWGVDSYLISQYCS